MKSIIFPAWEVQATLAGRKSQFRRVVKLPERIAPDKGPAVWELAKRPACAEPGEFAFVDMAHPTESYPTLIRCPYAPGERLFVKESWWQRPDDGVIVFDVDGALSFDKTSYAHQMGIGNVPCEGDRSELPSLGFRKRRALRMPEWASRLTLEVVAVRVERLDELTNYDAMDEGCPGERWHEGDGNEGLIEPWEQFVEQWDSSHGRKPGCAWADNPWAWICEFKRVEEST